MSSSGGVPSVRVLRLELTRQGFELLPGTKHVKVVRGGTQVGVMPVNDGASPRSARNHLAELKRAGFVWPPPPREKKVMPATAVITPRAPKVTTPVSPAPAPKRVINHKPFDFAAHLVALGLDDHREYDALRRARQHLDGPKLLAALVERAGFKSAAARGAGVPVNTVTRLATSAPNINHLGRLLRYLNQPISAFMLPDSGEAPAWPKNLATHVDWSDPPTPLFTDDFDGEPASPTPVPNNDRANYLLGLRAAYPAPRLSEAELDLAAELVARVVRKLLR